MTLEGSSRIGAGVDVNVGVWVESAVGEAVGVALGAGEDVAGGSVAVGVVGFSVQLASSRMKITSRRYCFCIVSLFVMALPIDKSHHRTRYKIPRFFRLGIEPLGGN